MDAVPAYLAWYLLKIRKHSGEVGYLKRRFENVGLARAIYEKTMLRELFDLHLIAFSDKEDDVTFNPLVFTDERGAIHHRAGAEHRVTVPSTFIMLGRGHFLWTEYVFSGAKWLLASFLGAAIAMLLGS